MLLIYNQYGVYDVTPFMLIKMGSIHVYGSTLSERRETVWSTTPSGTGHPILGNQYGVDIMTKESKQTE